MPIQKHANQVLYPTSSSSSSAAAADGVANAVAAALAAHNPSTTTSHATQHVALLPPVPQPPPTIQRKEHASPGAPRAETAKSTHHAQTAPVAKNLNHHQLQPQSRQSVAIATNIAGSRSGNNNTIAAETTCTKSASKDNEKPLDSSSSSDDSDDDSDSSSDSSSNSSEANTNKKKASNAPQFSVKQSDTGGLRMKFALSASTAPVDDTKTTPKSQLSTNPIAKSNKPKKSADVSSSTNTSCCSACSQSDSDSSFAVKPAKPTPTRRFLNKTLPKSVKSKSAMTTAAKSLIKRKRSATSSSESDSDSNSHEFDNSKKANKFKSKPSSLTKSSKVGNALTKITISTVNSVSKIRVPVQEASLDVGANDGASSSDMELPALVSAAIQRVESYSEGENSKSEPIVQYTSSLLHDFMVKTQMLGAEKVAQPSTNDRLKNASIKTELPAAATTTIVKRKRGRPRKIQPVPVDVVPTSESPDSGIISTPQSPAHPTLSERISTPADFDLASTKRKYTKRNTKSTAVVPPTATHKPHTPITTAQPAPRLNLASLEKSIYATERVLYPPRRKKRDPSVAPPKSNNAEPLLDPTWKRIDINKKFRRPSVSGYKSDGGTICSKILAANSHLAHCSIMGSSLSQRNLSGYKSDYSCKSRRSCATGYKSDFSSKAKSCGYRSDASGKMRRVRRKRRLKAFSSSNSAKSPVIDLDILQLAGLSLGQSEENSRDSSLHKSSTSAASLMKKTMFRRTADDAASVASTSGKDILNNLCERVTKRLSGLDSDSTKASSGGLATVYHNKNRANNPRAASISCRRASAVSHCSSRSGGSRMHFRRRRRKRLKSYCIGSDANLSKMNSQIDVLAKALSLCNLGADGAKGVLSKRVFKKRKVSENMDALVNSSPATGKRRHKKAVQTQSPDDHKLPLKKRHYLLTPDGKHLAPSADLSETALIVSVDERLRIHQEECARASSTKTNSAKPSNKSVTPKKRHFLETTPERLLLTINANSSATHSNISRTAQSSPLPSHDGPSKKSSDATKKKNRLEGLLSKISPIAHADPLHGTTNAPPPGVFEPTVDLELQIPAHTIPAIITKTEIDSPRTQVDAVVRLVKDEPHPKGDRVVESLLNKTGGHLLLKRKRKKANRTGFPTLRKKKKKLSSTVDDTEADDTKPLGLVAPDAAPSDTKVEGNSYGALLLTTSTNCDRVPLVGEDASRFIERNSRPRLSVVSLERLQGKVTGGYADPVESLRNSAKRVRDSSGDSSTVLSKRFKTTAASPTATERSWPSDNEPLINFVRGRKKVRSKTESKLAGSAAVGEAKRNGQLVKNPFSKRSKVNGNVTVEPLKENHIKYKDSVGRFPVVKLKQLDQSQMGAQSAAAKPLDKAPTAAPKVAADKKAKRTEGLISASPTRSKLKATNVEMKAKPNPTDKTTKKPSADVTIVPAEKPKKGRKPKHIALEPPSQPLPASSSTQHHPNSADLNSSSELCEIKPFDTNDYLEHEPLPVSDEPSDPAADVTTTDSESTSTKKTAARAKKKYLVAGLFSDYFKETKHAADKATTTPRLNYTSEDYPDSLLPAPAYCESYFRRTVQDFLLPYDLWWAHDNAKLPGRHSVPSWNYKKIRTNVYIDIRPPNLSTEEQQVCSCKPPTECGDDCLNRLMYTECSPKTCPCADKCRNTNIQRHITAPGVERFMTEHKGWGVRTKQPIRKGIYILEYVGEVVTEREFKERMATMYTKDTHHYCLNLDGGLVIDGHRMGSDGRFVNHSCAPNCEIQKWSVNGLFRMALFSLRDIRPDEELTYDYNFSLFNPSEGQPCRCNTAQCRGVIGGKSQRVRPIVDVAGSPNGKTTGTTKGKTGRPRKNKANKNQSFMHFRDGNNMANYLQPTSKELAYIHNGNCFLMRNMRKLRRVTKKLVPHPSTPTVLTAQISALRLPRNIRTRGVTTAEHDPAIEKTARIAGVLREICQELAAQKDSHGQPIATKLAVPSKRKLPQYFERVAKPIDMSAIESNVETGTYTHPSLFDEDVLRMCSNAVKYYGLPSAEADAAQLLLDAYTGKKEQWLVRLQPIAGSDAALLQSFGSSKPNQLQLLHVDPNEDIIRCICGMFIDEGIMIQCAKCLVWQHTHCTGADTSADNYLCEQCDPERVVDLEIRLDGERNIKGFPCYLSLLRGDLQVRQTDTVYVLRDIPIQSTNPASPVRKHTYETIGSIDFAECDIFRIEQLWKDDEGRRFAYGHHYLRPHETYHEPTRKFYQNEVMRVPLYEEVPIEMIMGRCWVLDTTTFCKGRPVDSAEEHVYICELRVDKTARSFAKVGKNQYPVCQKSYAFQKFEQKLKIQRNYMPHDVNAVLLKPKKKKAEDVPAPTVSRKIATPIVQLMPIPPKTLNEKRSRLETHLSRLLTCLKACHPDSNPPVDLTYLLTGRGTRRRTNHTTAAINSNPNNPINNNGTNNPIHNVPHM